MNKITDIDIKNKKVLIRVDFNVPIENSEIKNYFRINSSLETIKYCLSQNSSIILMSHLGRPNGNDKKLSLAPIVQYLEQKLDTLIHFSDNCVSSKAIEFSKNMLPKEIHLLENLRFHKKECQNDKEFSRKLSKHADIYICDSFGISHRMHSSNSSILQFFDLKAIGFLMLKELKYLSPTDSEGTTIVIGGAKISSKIKMIFNYLNKCDSILIGGAMAFTLLKSKGINIGKSLVEDTMLEDAKKILETAEILGVDIILPTDVVCSESIDGQNIEIKNIDSMKCDDIGLDIGPETTMIFSEYISNSKKIIWNGPMGLFENFNFATGSTSIANLIKELTINNELKSIIGGGDTVRAIELTENINSFTHVSTGGGASLKLLSGEKLDLTKSWSLYE
jgi:3-phosphoglycerate kinase